MINSELRQCADYFPVVCLDSGLSPRRVQVDENYKHANERSLQAQVVTEEVSEDDYLYQYRSQRTILMDILSYAGIPSLRFNNTEGDDIMYILSKLSEESLVLTDDADMLQLLSDSCKVRRPMHNITYDINKFLEEYNYSEVYDFVINKSIIGDGSDNIPGCCKGVGGGTSPNLLKIMKLCNEKNIKFSEIIHNEEELRKFCKDNEIKFFKAYLNFDIDRFARNLKLVDLNKIKTDPNITEFLIESIISIISNCRNNVNYFSFIKKLNEYAIKDVPADELIANVQLRFNNIIIGE